MERTPPLQTIESFTIKAAAVLRKSGSIKDTDPERERDPEPSVMAPVTTPLVSTTVSLVPTIVTVTVDVPVPPKPSLTKMV